MAKKKGTHTKDIEFKYFLNDKQKEALFTTSNEILYGGAKGGGKLVSLTTQVLTPSGWTTMGEIHPGDYVFGDDGKPTLVVAESEIDIEEDTYEVIFDDGSKLIAGARHEWYTQTLVERNSNKIRTPEFREKRRASRAKKGKDKRKDLAKANSEREYVYDDRVAGGIRNTEEILKTLKVGKMNASNHAIPIAKPLQYEEQELPIHPYVLGAWLGDGNHSSGQFTGIDPEIWERFEELGYEISHHKEVKSHYILGIKSTLKEIGVFKNKSIPDIYKRSSYEQRLQLLQGIMDTDGHVEVNGGCQLSLSDEQLANDTLEVIRSLGIKCSMRKNKAFLYGVRKKDRFRMSFTTTEKVCSLPRKVERLPKKVRPTTQVWYITDVVKVEKQKKKCIQVANDSHLYLIGENLIPTHNSFLAKYLAILFSYVVPGLQTYIFRRTYAEVRGNFLYGDAGLIAMLREFEEAGLCDINLSTNRIHFSNGSDIYLSHMQTAQDVEQVRGRDVHQLICDEATQWLTQDIYNQLRTCMRCSLQIDYDALKAIGMDFMGPGYFPRTYLLSNPGGIGHGFIKAEFIDLLEPNTPTQMPPEKGGMLREFIPAFLEDNTALMNTDPNYKNKLIGSGKHVRAMLDGDWSIPDGAALADEWNPEENTIEPFEIPVGARIKRCFDWGLSKPYAVTYCWETMGEQVTLSNGDSKVYPIGTIIVVGELYGWNGNPDEGCRHNAFQVGASIKEYETNRPWNKSIVEGPSDGSIFSGTGLDKTMNSEVIEGFNSVTHENNDYSKIMRTSLFIPADRSNGSRAKGLALVKSALAGAHTSEEGYPSERPGLIFFRTVVQCIRTLPILPFDLNKPDDVDTRAEDHLYDTIRYAVLGRTEAFTPLEIIGY